MSESWKQNYSRIMTTVIAGGILAATATAWRVATSVEVLSASVQKLERAVSVIPSREEFDGLKDRVDRNEQRIDGLMRGR